jgi:sugar (glycoside-pentoside-hexuronide) transporter
LYTGINTPVTAILGSLTPDSHERVVLTSFRMVGSKLGVLVVNLTVLGFVARLGHGNDRRGYMLVMPIYAVGTIVLYMLAFRNLREITPGQRHNTSVRRSLRALQGNVPWMIIFLSSLFFWIAFIARISSAPYFFQYVLHRKDLTSIANGLDVVSLASILLLPMFCSWISKRSVWALGLAGSVAAQFVVFAGVRSQSVATVMSGWVIGFLASGVAMAMPFSLLSDSVDYGEWNGGVRAAGLLTAVGAAFCLKAGSGLGGALPAWILARFHYVPNVEQTARSIRGIELSCVWLPAIGYALAVLPVLFYYKYERLESRIREDLQQRRQVAAAMSNI